MCLMLILIILVCSSSPLVVFKKELDKDVAGDTSGNFAKLLLALVQVSSISAWGFLFVIVVANICCEN